MLHHGRVDAKTELVAFVVVELSSHQVGRVMCVLRVAILERKTLACPCIAFLRKNKQTMLAKGSGTERR